MKFSRKEFLRIMGFGVLLSKLTEGKTLALKKFEEMRGTIKKLEIRDVDIYYFDIPLLQPFTISLGTSTAANDVLIRVHTDQGIFGLGEACPFAPITGETQETNVVVARNIREMILGKDPLAIENVITEIGTLVHTNPSIVAAFDMALFDIMGKVASLPLYKLLGGGKSSFESDMTVDLDTPENMVKKAKNILAKGYRTIKVKVGQEPSRDVLRIQSIRDAIGFAHPIRIDANQGWTVSQAIEALNQMEKYQIQFVEQPVVAWDTAGLQMVRRKSPIPIMADEAVFSPQDALKLIKNEACDFFNIKLMKAGGILNSLKISHVAESANIRCMVGCMLESRLALTAAAHLAASQKNIVFADLDSNNSHTIDPVVNGIVTKNGIITLPDLPGLGADIDPSFLKKLRKA